MPMNTKARIEDGRLHVSVGYDSGDATMEFSMDLHDVFESLTEEDCEAFAECLPWDSVCQKVVNRMAGEDFIWGDLNPSRVEFLAKVEHEVLSGYKWNVWRDVRERLKAARSHEHLYWKLYHHGPTVRLPDKNGVMRDYPMSEWLRRNKIESNYTTNTADEDVKAIEAAIREFAGRE